MCAYNWHGPYPPRRSVIVRAGERDSAGVINKRVNRARKHAVSPSTPPSQSRQNAVESPPDSLLNHLAVSSPSSSASSSSSSPWSSMGTSSDSIIRSAPFPSSTSSPSSSLVVEAPQHYRLDDCFPFNNERIADEEMRFINSVCRLAPAFNPHHAAWLDHSSNTTMDADFAQQSTYNRPSNQLQRFANADSTTPSSTLRFCPESHVQADSGLRNHHFQRVKTTVLAATSSLSSGGVVHQVRERSHLNWAVSNCNPPSPIIAAQTSESMDHDLHVIKEPVEHDEQVPYNNHKSSCQTETEETEEVDLADVHQADSDGDLLIHIAVAKENELQVSQLIHLMTSSNKSLDVYNKMKQTPLHVAIMTGHLNILRRLLSAGCSPHLPDRHGNSALHLAVKSSSLACVNALLECPSSVSALHQRNYNGFMPLHLAVFRRDTDLVGLLVAKGAECNVLDGTSGRTPLYHATLNGHEDVVRKLISLGASVNVANYAGVTPLVVATDRRLKSITSLLISRGATINARDDNT